MCVCVCVFTCMCVCVCVCVCVTKRLGSGEVADSTSRNCDRHLYRCRTLVNTVMGCCPVSSRLITIRLRAVPFNITTVQAYAPTSDYDDNKIEELYDQLQNVIDQTPKKDILVQGDWNAKVGRDACGNWQGICGPLCNNDTNERIKTSGICHL